MYLIREIMYCKPGKVRALTGKAMEKAMDGYHDLVDQGRREIYSVESK